MRRPIKIITKLVAAVLLILALPSSTFADKDKELLRAATNRDADRVKLLLDAGADVNARYQRDGSTALDFAKWGGHADIMETLKRAGAEAGYRPSTGPSDG